MKTSRLMQFVCVSVFVAGPALASAPIALCGGGNKAQTSEKGDKSGTVVKTEKKNDDAQSKDNEKKPSKDAA